MDLEGWVTINIAHLYSKEASKLKKTQLCVNQLKVRWYWFPIQRKWEEGYIGMLLALNLNLHTWDLSLLHSPICLLLCCCCQINLYESQNDSNDRPCKRPNFFQSLAFPVSLTHACQEIVLSAEPHASPDHYWLWFKKTCGCLNNCLCMRSMRQIFHKEKFDSPLILIAALVYFHGIPLCCINTARELYSRTDFFHIYF